MFKDSEIPKQIVIGRESSYDVFLPLGSEDDGFMEDVYAQVTDTRGTSSVTLIARVNVSFRCAERKSVQCFIST